MVADLDRIDDKAKQRVALNEEGFIKTGSDLTSASLAARWPRPRVPHLLEPSDPGVFAVGVVRAGNVRHVASQSVRARSPSRSSTESSPSRRGQEGPMSRAPTNTKALWNLPAR